MQNYKFRKYSTLFITRYRPQHRIKKGIWKIKYHFALLSVMQFGSFNREGIKMLIPGPHNS